jgi:hypothetical protein
MEDNADGTGGSGRLLILGRTDSRPCSSSGFWLLAPADLPPCAPAAHTNMAPHLAVLIQWDGGLTNSPASGGREGEDFGRYFILLCRRPASALRSSRRPKLQAQHSYIYIWIWAMEDMWTKRIASRARREAAFPEGRRAARAAAPGNAAAPREPFRPSESKIHTHWTTFVTRDTRRDHKSRARAVLGSATGPPAIEQF